jgi:hypothetical protein
VYGAIAIVKHVEESEGRFYAEAEIVLNEDVDMVKLELADLSPQLPHAEPLLDVRAGTHTFGVSGNCSVAFSGRQYDTGVVLSKRRKPLSQILLRKNLFDITPQLSVLLLEDGKSESFLADRLSREDPWPT